MQALGNVLWNVPFMGFVNASMVYLFGLLITATGIGAPIGLGLMEYGKFLFAPFGREMVSKSELGAEQNKNWQRFSLVMSILWAPFGALMWMMAIVQIVLCSLSIIGFPVAVVVAKSLRTYFNPVNKKCVAASVKQELERKKGKEEINRYLTSEKQETA